ncbi:glyoxalase [Paenibacillus zeisoli]|uniref:Glyoxalase n=1 Tax=Paenibacillus zeisoli TaxID=2496267 RepID=A0A433X766_9BACL|nr:VOC family protein [Paenibacillus zeisoli]RUT29870.1 glyoxalase [Paenibacillus zeisoli]
MVPERVTLVTLGTFSMPKLRAFYRGIGWEETPTSNDQYSVFTTAGVLLSLYPYEELLKDAGLQLTGIQPVEPAFRGITLAINVEEPEQVDDIMEQVRKAGAKILREPHEASWGGRTAYFADPENHVWEVAWNPSALFDESGAMISF